MAYTTSPNMSLPIPTVGSESGPAYATDVNNALSIIDSHTHSSGSGVQITPSGLNISANLPFQGNSATGLYSVVFNSQGSALSGSNFLSFINGNLYVNDGSGNQIQMTSSGGVAGTSGSIGSLTSPAAATYVSGSKTFVWTSGSSKSAAMDNGAVTIRSTGVASANGVTLQSVLSLASAYSLTLPSALPGTGPQYMTSDTSGNLSFSTADSIGSGMTSTGANAVGSSMGATGANAIAAARTRATGSSTEGAGGVAISSTCGGFSTSNTTYTAVTNLSVTLTTSGRPIFVGLISDGSGSASSVALYTTTNGAGGYLRIYNATNSSLVASFLLEYTLNGSSNAIYYPSAFSGIDFQSAGTYNYTAAVFVNTSSYTFQVNQCKLIAYEL